ncbi:MAG: glycosyltransferase family 2 protein, partial [Nanoarchaeota archaeon]
MEASIVIPTLNEEKNIRILLQQIDHKKYEIIVVDGGSTDKTVEIAKRFGVIIIYTSKGKGAALRKGMDAARSDIIVTMDADLSHRISEINLLIEAVKSGYDICMGSRFIMGGGTDDMPLYRKLGNKFFIWLVNALWGTNYSDLCYGYRSFRKSVIKKLNLESDGFGIETEISIKAAKKKLKIIEIPSYEKKRLHGEGKL